MLVSQRKENGLLARGAIVKVANCFGVSRECISQLWKRSVCARDHGLINSPEFVSPKKFFGRKQLYPHEILKEETKKVPKHKRQTTRKLANRLGVSKTTIWREMKSGVLKPSRNRLKPHLTEKNQIARLFFCLSKRKEENKEEYQEMFDTIHIDEKWFYITFDGVRYILTKDEEGPHRTVH
jgi:transcriptional regulator with XRE-family HTH domain